MGTLATRREHPLRLSVLLVSIDQSSKVRCALSAGKEHSVLKEEPKIHLTARNALLVEFARKKGLTMFQPLIHAQMGACVVRAQEQSQVHNVLLDTTAHLRPQRRHNLIIDAKLGSIALLELEKQQEQGIIVQDHIIALQVQETMKWPLITKITQTGERMRPLDAPSELGSTDKTPKHRCYNAPSMLSTDS